MTRDKGRTLSSSPLAQPQPCHSRPWHDSRCQQASLAPSCEQQSTGRGVAGAPGLLTPSPTCCHRSCKQPQEDRTDTTPNRQQATAQEGAKQLTRAQAQQAGRVPDS